MNQNRTPLFTAVKNYVEDRVIQFHVPGHRQGQGLPELAAYIGERVLQMDANGMPDLDYINNPGGVILEAEKLLAEAFGAQKAHFLVNGTTAGVHAMIMSVCNPGDKIILPRNAHKSAISGIILSGALPVYVQPEINLELGIAMGVPTASYEKALKANPDARVIFVINPTYYGYTSDLGSIIKIGHQYGAAVLVDEAHGAHMYFHEDFPATAMQLGADISAASMHKTGGSMTQSSILLYKTDVISPQRLHQVINLNCTSSASYLLMCSLDIARKQLAMQGRSIFQQVLEIARQTREEINCRGEFYAFGQELTGTPGCYGFDESKLGINIRYSGLTGYQLENKLRRNYNIQMELSDLHNILGIVSLGHQYEDLKALIHALQDIARQSKYHKVRSCPAIPDSPEMVVPPRQAFYSRKKRVLLKEAAGEIAGEMIMAYPPGIPVICIGERISHDIIDYIQILKEEQCELQGFADPSIEHIQVLAGY
jgi:arginine decarboxylase